MMQTKSSTIRFFLSLRKTKELMSGLLVHVLSIVVRRGCIHSRSYGAIEIAVSERIYQN